MGVRTESPAYASPPTASRKRRAPHAGRTRLTGGHEKSAFSGSALLPGCSGHPGPPRADPLRATSPHTFDSVPQVTSSDCQLPPEPCSLPSRPAAQAAGSPSPDSRQAGQVPHGPPSVTSRKRHHPASPSGSAQALGVGRARTAAGIPSILQFLGPEPSYLSQIFYCCLRAPHSTLTPHTRLRGENRWDRSTWEE